MNEQFSADFFVGNRLSLVDKTSAPLIVIAANGLLQRSADTTFAFRQDSNFWYLTGIDEPDYLLVIAGDESFLIAPSRAEHRDMWDGEVDTKKLQAISGIDDIMEHHIGCNRFDRLLKKYKKVHTITPAEAYFDNFGFYANPARGSLLTFLNKHRGLELVDIRKDLASLRQIKQPVELQALQSAIDITTETLLEIQKKLASYDYEYEITADITASFIRKGATGHAYLPIVAAGRNAATIHYIKNHDPINPGDFILMDVGAEVSNYSADITRTMMVGPPTKRQRQIYEAVLAIQKEAFKILKPGVQIKEYEQAIDAKMAKQLQKIGLLNDISDRKKLKKYYPHLTSHYLGLDTHDSADYEQPLQPGMVLTVEPGIYIPEENIGVRIEDNVLITNSGIEVLSKKLPSSL